MDEQPPERVRVVLAGGARTPRPDAAAREIEERTAVGEVLVRGLIRTQLSLALRLSVLVGVLFGIQPVLFATAPGVSRAQVAGIPVPWLLLGLVAYPVVFGIAWGYVRAAERNERRFTELVTRE